MLIFFSSRPLWYLFASFPIFRRPVIGEVVPTYNFVKPDFSPHLREIGLEIFISQQKTLLFTPVFISPPLQVDVEIFFASPPPDYDNFQKG